MQSQSDFLQTHPPQTQQQQQQQHHSSKSSYYEFNEALHGVYVVGQVGHPRAKIVRIVHISDTHGSHYDLLGDVPMGHVLIHSGDFGEYRFSKRFHKKRERERQLARMEHFFRKLPHPYKIFVPGNEDFSLESLTPYEIQRRLPSAIYLHDNSCTLFGLKFYGSPWNVAHGGSLARGFSRGCSSVQKHWARIPDSTDVLITHMDPWCSDGLYAQVANRIKPIVHLFGDDLEASGITWKDHILFSNGAMQGKHSTSGEAHRRHHRYSMHSSSSGGLLSSLIRHKSSSLDRRYVNLHSGGPDSKPNPIVIDVYVVTDDPNYVELPLYPPPAHLLQQTQSQNGNMNNNSQRKRCRRNSFSTLFSGGKSSSHSSPGGGCAGEATNPPENSIPCATSSSSISPVSDPLRRHLSMKRDAGESAASGVPASWHPQSPASPSHESQNLRRSHCVIS